MLLVSDSNTTRTYLHLIQLTVLSQPNWYIIFETNKHASILETQMENIYVLSRKGTSFLGIFIFLISS
jgi:hypothetical protein